jgi:8-oxo-dGTP diphosphatase
VSWTTLAGAGGIVVNDSRVLMVRQHRPYGVHWEFPSGYYEPGESFEETAAREVLEETAIVVEVGELICTMVWKREHDRRRNVLAYFLATPVDPTSAPRAQVEEDIEEAAYIDADTHEVHPLHEAILERWWNSRAAGFHLDVDVSVRPDGTQAYVFRS